MKGLNIESYKRIRKDFMGNPLIKRKQIVHRNLIHG